jgi:hypothetical protein
MPGFEEMYRFSARLRDYPLEMRPLVKIAMQDAAAQGEQYSRMLVPVKTGKLRDSIAFRGTSDRGWDLLIKAAATMDYATFVEYGTSRFGPRPFMMPGVELAADVLEDQLGIVLKAL